MPDVKHLVVQLGNLVPVEARVGRFQIQHVDPSIYVGLDFVDVLQQFLFRVRLQDGRLGVLPQV